MDLKINQGNSEIIIAVVIPCYRVRDHILDVISNIGSDVTQIYVVDDCCPDSTGDFVEINCKDNRVIIIRHEKNQGVGGSVISGYCAAIRNHANIIVKIDGDGQMDPSLLPLFIEPILNGHADYTKGNRFYNIESLSEMPKIRLFGNAVLSFMTKFSSGYWDLFDPTNGYTAIHVGAAAELPFSKISKRYFFESDMLFRLNTIRAVVIDIPMDAKYKNEISGLIISNIFFDFLFNNIKNFFKRIFYNYYVRDMSLASIELPLGVLLISFGVIFGGFHWYHALDGVTSSAGTVMLSALPLLMGLQLILAFLSFDISSVPRTPRQILLGNFLHNKTRSISN
jgi:dolichol-phosphate mannosyltransferase